MSAAIGDASIGAVSPVAEPCPLGVSARRTGATYDWAGPTRAVPVARLVRVHRTQFGVVFVVAGSTGEAEESGAALFRHRTDRRSVHQRVVLRLRDGHGGPRDTRACMTRHGAICAMDHRLRRSRGSHPRADIGCRAPSAAREWAALRDARHPRRRVHWGQGVLFASSRISR